MGTHYLWDDVSDNIVAEYDDQGNTIAQYTTEPTLYGNVISQRRNGQSHFFHYDGSGNTIAVTDSTATVTDTRAYTAFGESTESTGTTEFPFQFVGQKGYYRDEETGEYSVRRRPYEPVIARWKSVDPLVVSLRELNRVPGWRLDELINPYQYVGGLPTGRIDPSGEDFIALAHYHIALANYHYSLEYWECFCDSLGPPIRQQIELPNQLLETVCHPTKWVELSTAEVRVWAQNVDTGRYEKKLVKVSVIVYDISKHGPIAAILPIFGGTVDEVTEKWDTMIDIARNYKWAEQQGFGEFMNWADSLYHLYQTNSRTFIKYVVEHSDLWWQEMAPGRNFHPGDDWPRINYYDSRNEITHLIWSDVKPFEIISYAYK